ncbi:MAG: helix-turn-helix domain-containing protein, partial [Saprospiraceae bacterium]
DYLVKPFDNRELKVRAHNLIELRAQLRKRFSEENKFAATAIRTNSVDQSFLEKVCAVVEAHISDEQFGVEDFAQQVGMSRVHLNRKLKALTDQSANKFIQSFRLQRAYQLLEQNAGNVSEIAFETGFGSTAYFVKCFREKYGKTPGTLLDE